MRNGLKYCGMGRYRISKVSDKLYLCYHLVNAGNGYYWDCLNRFPDRDDAVKYLDQKKGR